MKRPIAFDTVERIGGASVLDGAAKAAAGQVRSLLSAGGVKDALSGTWLGHPVHPMLTDVPIGSWTSATVLDLLGGARADPAARRLIAVGIAAAVPTAVTGLSDWSDSEMGDAHVRRVGIVHAAANVGALGLYGASLVARLRGRRGGGVRLGVAGLGVLTVGGLLGGHLSYARGVGVDTTTFDSGPTEWTPVLDASMLADDRPTQATAGTVEVLLVRRNGTIYALADRCNHRGGPLHEGELVDGCIQCPWHGARYHLESGSVARGPATYAQPRYEARVQDGRVEVRAAA